MIDLDHGLVSKAYVREQLGIPDPEIKPTRVVSWAHRVLCRLGLHVWLFGFHPSAWDERFAGAVHCECLCCGRYDEWGISESELAEITVGA